MRCISYKIVIIILVGFAGIHFANAQESVTLNESGSFRNIRFEKESGFGKVYYKDNLLFNGMDIPLNKSSKKVNIDLVSINHFMNNTYLSVCGLVGCRNYILSNLDGSIRDADFGGKYGIDYLVVSPDKKYLAAISFFYEGEGDGILTIYDLSKQKELGDRYIKNIEGNLEKISFKGNTVEIIRKDGKSDSYKISDFSETSLKEDYDTFERNRKIKEKLKKYSPYLGVIAVVVILLKFLLKRKRKTTS